MIIRSLVTVGAVHTHTHTHTRILRLKMKLCLWLVNVFLQVLSFVLKI